jgi:hypothetical protein
MYESTVWRESRLWPGVRFQVLRMSLIRRHRLMQELKHLASEETFHRAALADTDGEISAAELQTRIDEMVIRTALRAIEGLNIDRQPATVENLLENGPETLTREIAEAIAEETSLGETERKN